MANNTQFFEINKMDLAGGFSANLVMVENNGNGPAYLGWCESLAIDTNALPDSEGMLFLPSADIGIMSQRGAPVPAPAGWEDRIVRSLVIQDFLLVMIETELELTLTATS